MSFSLSCCALQKAAESNTSTILITISQSMKVCYAYGNNCQQKSDDTDFPCSANSSRFQYYQVNFCPMVSFFNLFCTWAQGNMSQLKATSSPRFNYSMRLSRAPPYNCKRSTSCSVNIAVLH